MTGHVGVELERQWLIWSEEHGAWWAPESGGYRRSIREAGRYSLIDAKAIVERANRFGFNEIAVFDPVKRSDR